MITGNICPGPVNRREFMQVGALTLGGISLPEVLAARESAGTSRSDTAVILLYLNGGASQLETYDLKPGAPSDYRSVFHPISTDVPGMDLCELFPLQARLGKKIAIVRSLHHTMTSHSDGGIQMLTGKTPPKPDPTSNSLSEHPDFGHVTSRLRRIRPECPMPSYVAMPQKFYMTHPAYLGVQHGAFEVGDPSAKNFSVPRLKLAAGVNGQGLNDRRGLLSQLDKLRSGLDQGDSLRGMDHFRDVAFQMLTNPETARAFDLGQEPETLRDRYGRHTWGQSCLLARRLAEAGTSVTSLSINTPKDGQEFTNWDDHILNAGRPGHFAKYMRVRLPYLDQALSALIEDIYQKSLDQRIMVVVMGEFGRTPRLSNSPQGVGRNHWPQAASVLFSGGGLRTGQVVGATNSKAEYPVQQPCSPGDVLATIYQHLGIPTHHFFTDFTGQPIPIVNGGKPIGELIS